MAPSDPAFRLRVADLPKAREVAFEVVPDAQARRALADALGLSGLRKVRLAGTLSPAGRTDWRLSGTIGATIVQPCVVTLAPVTTRIDEPLERLYLADPPGPPEGEAEMPEDDGIETLPEVIDLGLVLAEALALAVPAYPRAEGVELGEARSTPPGAAPISDEDTKPFAGLAALRDPKPDGGDQGGD